MVTLEQLKQIISPINYGETKMKDIVFALNTTFEKYEINSNKRICHFLAQVLHESSAFRYSVEIWGNTAAQKGYETRVDLGNTPEIDGDGYKYRGRGWIQLTGKANYKALSLEFNKDFVKFPELVATEPYDSLAAGWYWNKKGLNYHADADDINTITRKINGGFNGLNDRKMWLSKCKKVLNY